VGDRRRARSVDRPDAPGRRRGSAAAAGVGRHPEDLRAIARAAAFDALSSALYFLDDPGDDEVPDLPGWALIETSGGEPTGRLVQGLYEDMDPER
jgi:hypothetical protein